MQAKFHLKQLTVALAAAGFGLAVGAGYNRLDVPALSLANAAVSQPAVTSPVASSAASRLPDFTTLVARDGAAVVNISTIGTTKTAGMDSDDEDNPLNEFLKRFGMPNGPAYKSSRASFLRAVSARASSSARTATSSPMRTSWTAQAR